MTKMSVDTGFGRTKAINDDLEFDFPSVIGTFQPVKDRSELGGTNLIKQLAIDYDGQWFVGDSALRQSIPQNTIDADRTVNTEGLVLLMAAMAVMSKSPKEEVKLVVGLPVLHYNRLKTTYLNAVTGTHHVRLLNMDGSVRRDTVITVDDAKVLRQPFGTLYNEMLDDNGIINSKMAKGKNGVITIGYNTLELAVIDNLEYIQRRSTSFPEMGMYSIYKALSSEISENYGIDITPEKLESAVKTGILNIRGKEVSIEKHINNAIQKATGENLSKIKSFWPDRWELDRIFIGGGTSFLIGESVRDGIDHEGAKVVDSPLYSTVYGYQKYAQWTWRK